VGISRTAIVYRESLDSIESVWRAASSAAWLNRCLFITPPWLRAWWESFGAGREAALATIRQADRLLGLAPLMVEAGEVSFMGDPEVCDALDFAVDPDRTREFFRTLLDHLRESGMQRLNLGPIRPDSVTYRCLVPLLEQSGCPLTLVDEDVSYEMELPSDWDGFLQRLGAKQRHEVRRKLRRLHEAGTVRFRVLDQPTAIAAAFPRFLELFRDSRPDKAAFMTAPMSEFFQRLARYLGAIGRVRLGLLEVDEAPAAMVFCFDDGDTVFLYNNGYDPRFRQVDVGLLSKLLSVQDSIERGRRRYDFLKGNEIYKQRLGAEPVPIYRCRAELRSGR